MTIEQRYDEALKRAKKLYEQGTITESLSYVFPELKESEDEKIKKEIINYINFAESNNLLRIDDYEKKKGWIAWLEKQSTPQVRTGLEWLNTIDDACDKRYSEEYAHGEYCHEQSFKWGFQEGVDWLEEQGESTDINPSEFDLRLNKLLKQFETLSKEELESSLSFYLNVVQNDGTYKIDEKQDEQKPYGQRKECWDCQFNFAGECKGYCDLKRNEQKPAEWSEEDDYNVQCMIAKAVNDIQNGNVGRNNELIDWLKSLKDRVQPKQEWSEEDIRNIDVIDTVLFYDKDLPEDTCVRLRNWLESLKPQNNITDEELAQAKKDAYNDALDKIEYHSGEPTFDDGWSAAIDYIRKKSLKPQNHWKPTEAQLASLTIACDRNDRVGFDLTQLLKELKKL